MGLIERRTNWFVVLLLILLFAQTYLSAIQKSISNDELTYIASGYSYIKTGDLRMNPDHPNLIKLLGGLPLLLLNPVLPLDHYTWTESLNNPKRANFNQWEFGAQFLYGYNTDADKIILFSRIPMMFLSVLFGFYVFKFAKELYGKKAGLFALFLYSFSPNMLAHSRFVTTDLIAGFALISLYYLWVFLHNPTMKNSILLGLLLGLTFATKSTAIYLIPPFVVITIGFLIKNKFYRKKVDSYNLISYFVIIIFLTYFVFLGTYFFKDINSDYATEYFLETTGIDNSVISTAINIFPIPAPFLIGFADVIRDSDIGRPSFLMGLFSVKGRWYYYPIALLIKTPVAMIIFFVLSLIFFRKIRNYNLFDELLLILPALFFAYMFITSNWNIGLRHILPIYPPLFVFVSKLINYKKLQWLIVLLSLWYVISSLLIFPHYLSYFNELVGGSDNGHNYLIDSNLDWGQDLKVLKKWIDDNDVDFINLAYWGKDNPVYRNINYELLECQEPKTGLIAVSVNYLIGFSENWAECMEWLRESDNQPIDKSGYSIFIYNITS
jgi:hypothetical protein